LHGPRQTLREIKRRLIRFRQGPWPTITVVGTPRSGSTFVTDVLAADRGVWFANEPYALYPRRWNYNILRAWLPAKRIGHMDALDEAELAQLHRYTDTLLRAGVLIGRGLELEWRADDLFGTGEPDAGYTSYSAAIVSADAHGPTTRSRRPACPARPATR